MQGDVCDAAALDSVFAANKFQSVIHFAALKVRRPLRKLRKHAARLASLPDVVSTTVRCLASRVRRLWASRYQSRWSTTLSTWAGC